MNFTSTKTFTYLKRAALVLGLALLGLNGVGLVMPLQNPKLAKEQGKIIRNKKFITEAEFYEKIQRHGETIPDYATKLNEAVNQRLMHYRWEYEDGKNYWSLPVYKNYLLYLSRDVLYLIRRARGTLTLPNRMPVFMYEFSDYKKIIERGVGLCSQHAMALVSILQENQVSARIVCITKHVVTTVQIDPKNDSWWVFDPDYGVVIPHNIQTLVSDPSMVIPYYRAKGYSEERLAIVEQLYTIQKPVLINTVAEAHGKARYYFEFISYYLIWIIPVILILPSLIFRRKPAKSAQTAQGAMISPTELTHRT